MEKSQETLAGRLGILKLYGLSYREKHGYIDPEPLDFSMESLTKRAKFLPDNDIIDVFEHIWNEGIITLTDGGAHSDNPLRDSRYITPTGVGSTTIKVTVSAEGAQDVTDSITVTITE